MSHGFASLLSLRTAPADRDEVLGIHIGRTWDEVHAAINMEIMPDGLSRESLRLVVEERGTDLLGDARVAGCASHIVALVAPLAETCEEVDEAIVLVGAWLAKLAEGDLFERIRAAKESMNDCDLRNGPGDDADPDELLAWNQLIDYFVETCRDAQITFEVGGREVYVSLEQDCTLVVVETEPETSDLRILALFDHSGNGGGWDDGEDEPEPDPTPGRPVLLDA